MALQSGRCATDYTIGAWLRNCIHLKRGPVFLVTLYLGHSSTVRRSCRFEYCLEHSFWLLNCFFLYRVVRKTGRIFIWMPFLRFFVWLVQIMSMRSLSCCNTFVKCYTHRTFLRHFRARIRKDLHFSPRISKKRCAVVQNPRLFLSQLVCKTLRHMGP